MKHDCAVLPLIVAALAVFFGPMIQLIIAKGQIRASVLSTNRQRWIDQLREQLAEVVVAVAELGAYHKGRVADGPLILQRTREMQLCKCKIKLMVNPKEEDHRRLLELLDEATAGITKDGGERTADLPAIVALSQAILKREWERVKATN